MSRLQHDLKDLSNSISMIRDIMGQGDDELLKMKPIIEEELARLVLLVKRLQEEVSP